MSNEIVCTAKRVVKRTITISMDEKTAGNLSGLLFNAVNFKDEPWAGEIHGAIEGVTSISPTSFKGNYLVREDSEDSEDSEDEE